jgi:hypothetical protein
MLNTVSTFDRRGRMRSGHGAYPSVACGALGGANTEPPSSLEPRRGIEPLHSGSANPAVLPLHHLGQDAGWGERSFPASRPILLLPSFAAGFIAFGVVTLSL